MSVAKLAEPLLSLFFPPVCSICGEKFESGEERICDDCRQEAEKIGLLICHVCGAEIGRRSRRRCPKCPEGEVYFDKARSGYLYFGRLREAIHLFKYGQYRELGRELGRMMLVGLSDFSAETHPEEKADFLLPVPMHIWRRLYRGYNHSEVLAQILAEASGLPCLPGALIRHRHTTRQALLPHEKRLSNIRGAFTVPDSNLVRDKHIALVDDIMTSGSTVNECARSLREKGAREITVYTLARA
ncbi:MAG: ComF family protein [Candidatus Sumerlaeia bacterium]